MSGLSGWQTKKTDESTLLKFSNKIDSFERYHIDHLSLPTSSDYKYVYVFGGILERPGKVVEFFYKLESLNAFTRASIVVVVVVVVVQLCVRTCEEIASTAVSELHSQTTHHLSCSFYYYY